MDYIDYPENIYKITMLRFNEINEEIERILQSAIDGKMELYENTDEYLDMQEASKREEDRKKGAKACLEKLVMKYKIHPSFKNRITLEFANQLIHDIFEHYINSSTNHERILLLQTLTIALNKLHNNEQNWDEAIRTQTPYIEQLITIITGDSQLHDESSVGKRIAIINCLMGMLRPNGIKGGVNKKNDTKTRRKRSTKIKKTVRRKQKQKNKIKTK